MPCREQNRCHPWGRGRASPTPRARGTCWDDGSGLLYHWEKRALYIKGLKLEEKKKFEARHCLQTFFSVNNYTLSWPKSTFGFFISSYGKPEGTFWPTQYIKWDSMIRDNCPYLHFFPPLTSYLLTVQIRKNYWQSRRLGFCARFSSQSILFDN